MRRQKPKAESRKPRRHHEQPFQVSGFRHHPSRRVSSFIPPDSPSGLRSHPSSLSRLRLISNPGRITPTGLNAAIRGAQGDIIIRMDAHTEYAADYVRQCVEVLETTGADNVGGPAQTKAETYMEKVVAAAYHSPFSVGGARFHNVNYEGWVDTVTYGCWRRETFERFGYFDEELVRNQDDEHNLRILRGGGKIYQSPKIQSWYRPRGSLTALFKQYMQYGYWKVRVIQKHKLPASWRHLVPGAFVLSLGLLFLLAAFSFLLSPIAPSALGFALWSFCFLLLRSCGRCRLTPHRFEDGVEAAPGAAGGFCLLPFRLRLRLPPRRLGFCRPQEARATGARIPGAHQVSVGVTP